MDTLIMNDSSTIQLNLDKRNNFIHAKSVIAMKGARIMGVGEKVNMAKTERKATQ
ncbi:MAG: hypothetical protein WDO15_12285 [Bacteroidota bacterium]